MPAWHAARVKNAINITEALLPYSGSDGYFRLALPDNFYSHESNAGVEFTHAFYKYYAFFNEHNREQGISRDDVIQRLEEQGVTCMQGSCSEIYLERAFVGTSFKPKSRLPTAKKLGETSLMFLVHPGVQKVKLNME